MLQAHKFDYEISVDKVLESKEVQTSLKHASEAMINFWSKVEQLHEKIRK